MLSKYLSYSFLSLVLLTSSGAQSTEILSVEAKNPSAAGILPDTLVTAGWLKEHLDDPDLVVLDTSVVISFSDKGELNITSGRSQYEKEHIPTAGFADLTNDLVDTMSEYPYAMPSPEKFSAAMEALGVGDNSQVVLYANDYSAWAARVWWMLRWIGFDNAAILDGGMNAWIASGYQLSSDVPEVETASLSVSLQPDLIAEQDEVYYAIENENIVLIDSMPAAHYRGEMVIYGRAGHIPTAINIPAVFSEDGRFLSTDVLAEMHPLDREKRMITYCGGGISASANAFVMHRLGFTDVAVYMNSLDEWAANPENPLSTE